MSARSRAARAHCPHGVVVERTDRSDKVPRERDDGGTRDNEVDNTEEAERIVGMTDCCSRGRSQILNTWRNGRFWHQRTCMCMTSETVGLA